MKTKLFLVPAVFLLMCSPLFSQDNAAQDSVKESKIKLKVTTDIVSSFIWRGTVGSPDPNIQPTVAVTSGGFEAGIWGSTDFRADYKEIDLYLAYTLKSFKISITDYDWIFKNNSFFDYKNASTDHILEAGLAFLGTEKFPLSISLYTMFYGADKKWDAASESFSTRQNYSTYLELGYTFGKSGIFLGMTPANGYYGAGYGNVSGFAVCNLGLTSTRNIRITPEFELPLKGTVYLNPQAESIHFVIGFTL
jgi:hypothetical protein